MFEGGVSTYNRQARLHGAFKYSFLPLLTRLSLYSPTTSLRIRKLHWNTMHSYESCTLSSISGLWTIFKYRNGHVCENMQTNSPQGSTKEIETPALRLLFFYIYFFKTAFVINSFARVAEFLSLDAVSWLKAIVFSVYDLIHGQEIQRVHFCVFCTLQKP